MARSRGKQNRDDPMAGDPRHPDDTALDPDEEERGQPVLPELARRALALGLSGFFFTEATIRKALGDTLPKEWTDFAIDQSERTRKEFLERLTFEIAQSLENIDVASVLAELLKGRTVEVKAEIRLREADGSEVQGHTLQTKLRGPRDEA